MIVGRKESVIIYYFYFLISPKTNHHGSFVIFCTQKEKRALEVRRLDLDAAKNRFKKVKSNDQQEASKVSIIGLFSLN